MKAFDFYYLRNAFTKRNIAFSARVQSFLQFFGIAIHNPFRDECCSDFECCSPKGTCWLHISSKQLPIKKEVWYEPTAPIGDPERTIVKKSKLVFRPITERGARPENNNEAFQLAIAIITILAAVVAVGWFYIKH